jgi:hypothetical protein
VRVVVVAFDVVEVDRRRDPGLLIQVHQVPLQVRIVHDAADVALEVSGYIESKLDEHAEQPPSQGIVY